MKVNPAFVSILIIASSLAIHLSTYIQPSYRSLGRSEIGPLRQDDSYAKVTECECTKHLHIMVFGLYASSHGYQIRYGIYSNKKN
jgi:hypothetical protein